MIKRLDSINYKPYKRGYIRTDCFADFETTSDKNNPLVNSWALGYELKRGNKEVVYPNVKCDKSKYPFLRYYGIGLKSFIDFIVNINFDIQIWFVNLRAFDGHFILPQLDKMGYEQVPPLTNNFMKEWMNDSNLVSEYNKTNKRIKEHDDLINVLLCKNRLMKLMNHYKKPFVDYEFYVKKWDYMIENDYSYMTNKDHKFYKISIMSNCFKKIKRRRIDINCTLNMFQIGVGKMGDTLNKQYNTNIYTKGKGDYNVEKLYQSIEELEADKEQLDYMLQDIFIPYKYFQLMATKLPRNTWKLTFSSTSLYYWRNIFGEKMLNKAIKNGEVIEIVKKEKTNYKYYKFKDGKKQYNLLGIYKKLIEKLLPTKWIEQESWNLQKYYAGGITHVNEKYRGQLMGPIAMYDLNSSYPAQMNKDTLVPFGEPMKKPTKGHNFKFYELIVINPIKNKKGLPFLKEYGTSEYRKTLAPGMVIYLTDISLPYVKKHYDGVLGVDYKLKVNYYFKSLPIKHFFASFVDYFWKMKLEAVENNDLAGKNVAKFYLNGLYGRLGIKINRESRMWNSNKGNDKWLTVKEEIKADTYFPLGCIITELARMNIVAAVGNNYNNNFVYCDTDSIWLIDKTKLNGEIHPSKLGAWDCEVDNVYGIFRRSKQYIYINKQGKQTMKFAGIKFKDDQVLKIEKNILLKDYILGKIVPHQLRPKRLPTGVHLEDCVKIIAPVFDEKTYKPMKEQIHIKKEDFVPNFNKVIKEIAYWISNSKSISSFVPTKHQQLITNNALPNKFLQKNYIN